MQNFLENVGFKLNILMLTIVSFIDNLSYLDNLILNKNLTNIFSIFSYSSSSLA